MADLGVFTADFASLRRVMAAGNSSQPVVRWKLFATAAAGAARCVSRGLSRANAADALRELAHANGLMDENAIQDIVAEAFEDVIDVVPLPLDAPPQRNGAKSFVPIALPIFFPFPIDGPSIPRRPWIVPGLLLRRQVTVLVAPPGSGKSLLTLQLGMVCAAGVTEWNGWRPRGKFRVLIINSEEDNDEMRRRLCAARHVMNIPEMALDGFALAQSPDDIVVAKADSRTKTVTRTPMLDRIIQTITEQGIDILIVDPFAETFAGDENSNSELKWAGVLWREVARRTNCAVMLVHHTKKYAQNMAGDPDAGRGGGSLVGIARIVSTLFTMSEKEAQTFGKSPEERTKYIRFDDAKANLTLVTFNARWFEKISCTLNNGTDNEPADEVGVLMPWTAPDPLAGLTAPEVNKIFDSFEEGILDDQGRPTGDFFSLHKNSRERWAGTVVIRFRACNEELAKKILGLWVKNGMIEEYDAVTASSKGQTRKCIRVLARPGEVLVS